VGRLSFILVLILFLTGAKAFGEGPFVPNRSLTPGDILAVVKEDICVPGYTKKVRDVPKATKQEVFRRYGIVAPQKGQYEVDHLVSLELGGSNSIRNLFPQAYQGTWNARVKDVLENRLHKLVCAGRLDLSQAQREIASDWIGAYKKYFNTDAPISKKKKRHGSKQKTH
jgi:hypothetical protein